MRLLVYGLFELAVQWQSMLLIMAVLSIALGHFAGATYLAFGDSDLSTPWQPTLILAAAAALGGVLIAALSVIATNQPITADTIRSE